MPPAISGSGTTSIRVDEIAAERECDRPGLDPAGDGVGDRLFFLDLDETARGHGGGHEG